MILLTDTYDCLGKAIFSRLQSDDCWGGIKVIVPPEEDDSAVAETFPESFSARLNDSLFPSRMLNDIDIVIICTSNILYDQRNFFKTLIRTARESGVKRLVFVSSILARDHSAMLPRECRETELDIYYSGIPYIILRTNILMEHLSFFIGNPYENRIIYYPAGNGKINFVSSADIAELLYRILLEDDGHENRIYTLSHQEGYSFSDIALCLSRLKNVDIAYESIDPDLYRDALFQTLLPTDAILRLCNVAECVRQNKYNVADATLQRILSHSPEKKRSWQPLKNWFGRNHTDHALKNLSDYLKETHWNKVCDFS